MSLIVGSFGGVGAALADDDDDDDRADEGFPAHVEELVLIEPAMPQEAAELQVGLAIAALSADGADSLVAELEVEYGLTDWLQVSIGMPLAGAWPAAGDGAYGHGDLELGALAAWAATPAVLLALAVEVAAPTADPDGPLGEGEWAVEPGVRAAVDLGGPQLHALAALELGDEVGVELGAGLTVRVAPDWALTFEAAAEFEDDKRIHAAPGFVWHGIDDVELGLAALAAHDDAGTGWGAAARANAEF